MNIIHISLSFLFFFTYTFRNVFVVSTKNLCRTEQRDTLLKFKNEFEIQKSSCYDCSDNNDNDVSSPYPKTESWNNNTDCCYWDGITCDAKSGEVIELDLSCSCLHGRFHSNSTLFRFQNLCFLNLSHNDLYGQVPSSIEKLSHLTSLDLSDNQFSGQILSSVGKCSNLTSLRLTVNQFTGQIPSSIEKLSHLTFLDISHNQFSGKIPSSVGNLSQLTFLSFSSNPFSGPIPSSIGKLFYLETLNLAFNNLDGEIPSSFGNLNKLSFLRVDSNKLSGSFPTALLNLTNLSHLLLSKNRFTGKLPTNISSLSNFCSFYAPDNTFVGTLPSSLFTIPSLISIDLTNNNLVSLLCWNVSSPSNLQWLNLGNNNFRGPIPRSISKLVNLETLDISQWNTQGIKVDFRIFSQLKSLRDLRLSHLNTTTTIDLNAISSFSKLLSTLHLSGNHVLATNKSSVSDPPSQLIRYLYLSSCGITEFPELLRTQQNMDTLDISNNKIKGQVPVWLWMLPKIRYVDLSNNTFNGFQRPAKLGLSSSLEHLSGSKNNFTGNIPSFICELAYLRTLDLSDNNINGSIPLCLENLKTNLSVLNLHHNHLSGGLPENVFESLWSFDVGHNQLVGKLPRSLMNSSTLEVLNVESNQINDTAPFWLNSLQNLKVLVLRSNAFHGPIHQQASFHKLKIIDISHNHFSGILPSDYFLSWSSMSSPGTIEDRSVANYMGEVYYQDSIILMNKGVEMEMVRILTIYTAIDFSQNRFEGEIPRSIGQLKELHVLNLSNNAFSGHIPSSMGNLTALESLDVSQNKLSGEIPQELGNLSFLSYMNFSHNQFVGLVPGGTQFRTQPCSSFENNSRLFGPVLDDNCRRIHTTSSKQYEIAEAKEEEEEEEDFSWIAAAIGLVPGNVFGLAIGYTLFSYKSERSKINADAISPQLSRELKNLWTKESMKQPNQMDCRERRQLIYDPIF